MTVQIRTVVRYKDSASNKFSDWQILLGHTRATDSIQKCKHWLLSDLGYHLEDIDVRVFKDITISVEIGPETLKPVRQIAKPDYELGVLQTF